MELDTLHTNQRLILKELLRRGATVDPIDVEKEIFLISKNGRSEYLIDRFSSKISFVGTRISADKNLTRRIFLKSSIPAPKGDVFCGAVVEKALDYFDALKACSVLKPNWGSHGDGVKCNISTHSECEVEIYKFIAERGYEEPFIIEEQLIGTERRIFITDKGEYAVTRREPAFVVGDGIHDVSELIRVENEARAHYRRHHETSLCPIEIDSECLRHLAYQKLNLKSCPNLDQKIYLRPQSNLAKGGLAVDETALCHPSHIQLAAKALNCFQGLPCLGLDYICDDIQRPMQAQPCGFIEANSNPGLAMHAFPTSGPGIDIAKMLVNAYFDWL